MSIRLAEGTPVTTVLRISRSRTLVLSVKHTLYSIGYVTIFMSALSFPPSLFAVGHENGVILLLVCCSSLRVSSLHRKEIKQIQISTWFSSKTKGNVQLHCEEYHPLTVYLHMYSSNGTFVNGEKIGMQPSCYILAE